MNAKTFYERYQEALNTPLPPPPPRPTNAQQWINEMVVLTHRSEASIRRWLAGGMPDPLVIDILAKHFQCSPEDLFPQLRDADNRRVADAD